MNINKNTILKTAEEILITKGIDDLNPKMIARKLHIRSKDIWIYFKSDDEILLALYESFKNDLTQFLSELTSKNENPDAEISLLFKQLYFIFLQRPCYLMLIQEKGIINRNLQTRNAFFEIRKSAIAYLVQLLERGKNEEIFKTQRNTKKLAARILASFRELMMDGQLVREKLNELKIAKNNLE